jgi:hypothetical protein
MLAALLALSPAAGSAAPQKPWPDDFVSRVELLAIMQTLNANLLASRSATATLEKWCGDHGMAAEPKLIARRVEGIEKAASPETRERLKVEPGEPLKYRRVQLSCGDHILSEADNWYAPGRLSEDMNHLLETTRTPFGKAVQALRPTRRTIDAKILWSPLPEGSETIGYKAKTGADSAGGDIAMPYALFEHRAILSTADQTPISEVDETYTSEIFDFETKAPPAK